MSNFPPLMYVYYLVILIIIRFLGAIIFFDYYRKEKRIRFIALTGAFILLVLSPLIEILILELSDIVLYDFLFLISEIFSILGIYLLALIFFDYVSEYDKKLETTIGILISIGVILLYFVIPFDLIYIIIQSILLVIMVGVFVQAIYHRRQYLNLTSNNANYFILMAVVIIFNLILSIDPFTIELEILLSLSTISLSTFGIFIYVHLEYTLLLTQKYTLKDNYSHNLSQILQVIMGRVELVKGHIKSVEAETQLNKAREDCKRGSDLLYKIREL